LSHAIGVPVTTEADDDKALFLRHDSLVDMPAGDEMGENDGTHFACLSISVCALAVMVCGVVGVDVEVGVAFAI